MVLNQDVARSVAYAIKSQPEALDNISQWLQTVRQVRIKCVIDEQIGDLAVASAVGFLVEARWRLNLPPLRGNRRRGF